MSYPTKLGFFGYEDTEELEADVLAAQYLVQLHIAPGTVVNAVHDAIRHALPPGDFELRWFGHVRRVESTGPEFAKLLDACSISSALDREASASWKSLENKALPQCDQATMQSSARRGDVQFAAGDPAGALGYYQQALSACPGDAQVQFLCCTRIRSSERSRHGYRLLRTCHPVCVFRRSGDRGGRAEGAGQAFRKVVSGS